MKNTVIFAVILILATMLGCKDTAKDKAALEKVRRDSIRVADSVSLVAKNEAIEKKRLERKKLLEKGDTFTPQAAEAMLQKKIKDGKVFLLSEEGEALPFKFEGGKIMAISMPDGKLYQVEKDGDKVMIMVPGQGKMERKMINGKVYLVDDDDKMYSVKVVNKKLVAILEDGSEINLAKK
jgi:hypothetical protein